MGNIEHIIAIEEFHIQVHTSEYGIYELFIHRENENFYVTVYLILKDC